MAVLWTGSQTQMTTPGSFQARQVGCTCDPMLNQQGKGVQSGMKDTQGRPVFMVASGCSQHSAASDIGAYTTNAGTLTPLSNSTGAI